MVSGIFQNIKFLFKYYPQDKVKIEDNRISAILPSGNITQYLLEDGYLIVKYFSPVIDNDKAFFKEESVITINNLLDQSNFNWIQLMPETFIQHLGESGIKSILRDEKINLIFKK